MNPLRCASIASVIVLGAAWSTAALATNWQAYLPEDKFVYEIDADSVRVSDGLVRYQYRNRYPSAISDHRFDRPLKVVADCAGRRHAFDTGGAFPLLLDPVDEGSSVAYEVDTACRLAGLETKPGALPAWQNVDHGLSIDSNTLKVQDGLLYFDYGFVNGHRGGKLNTAVVECAARRRSEVVGAHYTLQRIVEGGTQARLAEAACRMAHLAMPPGPTPVPVDFGAAIAQEEAGDDNMLHDIVRPGVTERAGLVHFQYTTRLLSDGTSAQEDQLVAAVVDCAARRRSDDLAGNIDLQPVMPGTRGALQLARVCAIAAAQAKGP